MEWNGMNERNGMEWTGMEWNGMEWNRMEWNGMEWNEWNRNGLEWNGREWNGMEWNGMDSNVPFVSLSGILSSVRDSSCCSSCSLPFIPFFALFLPFASVFPGFFLCSSSSTFRRFLVDSSIFVYDLDLPWRNNNLQ